MDTNPIITWSPLTENGAVAIGNAVKKFRFWWVDDWTFVKWVDPTEFVATKWGNDIMTTWGNSKRGGRNQKRT